MLPTIIICGHNQVAGKMAIYNEKEDWTKQIGIK